MLVELRVADGTLPFDLAGLGVEGDKAGVRRAEIDRRAEDRDVAIAVRERR